MKTVILLSLCLLAARPQERTRDLPPHFIAMEYKGMSNCIYKVYVTDSLIFAAKVNGYITVQPNFGMGTSIPKDKMYDPEAYVDRKMDRYDDLLTDHTAFLKADKENFIIQRTDIKRVYHDPSKKWGMGYYPHMGKVEIEAPKTPMNRKGDREFILVGDQDTARVMGLFR
jgi:hypothetical protein